MVKKIAKFFQEMKLEMKKVSWSSKSELIAATTVTFVFVAILAVYIGVIDLLLSKLVTLLLK
ncbi:MAG: preprotein translocase subunit SecE [Candidatus Saelkia tenebricola]|nr:preprotein translocase subunit SecE [Candidatus Saelkia tenebricola]